MYEMMPKYNLVNTLEVTFYYQIKSVRDLLAASSFDSNKTFHAFIYFICIFSISTIECGKIYMKSCTIDH